MVTSLWLIIYIDIEIRDIICCTYVYLLCVSCKLPRTARQCLDMYYIYKCNI